LLLLIPALAVGLVILALRGGIWNADRPAALARPLSPDSNVEGRRPNSPASMDMSPAIADLEERLSALEAAVRARPERVEARAETTPRILTREEFERHYGGLVRAMLEEIELEEAERAEAEKVEAGVRDRLRYYTKVHRLDVAQQEELFLLLVRLKADVRAFEERYAPYGTLPHRESPDYELLRTAWDDLVAQWLTSVVSAIGKNEIDARRVIRDMATDGLRPHLPR
jgi:hypothetical protein